MRLRQIRIHTYRQFIDQRLEVLPDVTALVGRNDSGKTGLMLRLIDQHFFERVVHGSDQSRVPGPAGREIEFDTVWDVSADDYRHFRIAAAFRRDDARTVETQFRQGAPNPWQYIVNGDPLRDAYVTEGGRQYQSRLAEKDAPALVAMRRLAAQYPRYGYRRIQIFLKREGHAMSPTRQSVSRSDGAGQAGSGSGYSRLCR